MSISYLCHLVLPSVLGSSIESNELEGQVIGKGKLEEIEPTKHELERRMYVVVPYSTTIYIVYID